MIKAAILAQAWPAVTAALFAGLLTLLSMTKIWNEAFWKEAPEDRTTTGAREPVWQMVLPVVVLATLTVAIGLAPQALFAVADRAAVELLDLESYRAVAGLGGGGP